ncbi:MAG: DUF1700 domain-containing protein [Clostridia bacterium]|nr:DUF1700 domain-containing protein [Clostridia bacterium]NCC45253.1 DUF1700 domain-containing protein [Clostridia bacterium]
MNRDEFMAQLARLLVDLPESERMEAIRYYNDYFDEAGEENESKVIQKLGSPGKVAAGIRSNFQDIESDPENMGFDTGVGNGSNGGENQKNAADGGAENESENGSGQWQNQNGTQNNGQMGNDQYNMQPHHTNRGAGKWALIIIVLVFASPLILGVGGGALGVFVGILGVLFGVLISFLAGGIGMAIGGVALMAKGIFNIFGAPAVGLMSIGGGLVFIALGILCLMFSVWFIFRLIPRVFRATVNFISGIFHKKRGEAA